MKRPLEVTDQDLEDAMRLVTLITQIGNSPNRGGHAVQLVAEALAAARQEFAWHAVLDSPQGDDRYVLTHIRGGIIDRWFWTSRVGFSGMGGPVTHWRELPSLPQGVDE